VDRTLPSTKRNSIACVSDTPSFSVLHAVASVTDRPSREVLEELCETVCFRTF